MKPLEKLDYGQGPTVILFHGAASNASQWRELIQLMYSSYHLVAINQYGYGASPSWLKSTPLTLQQQIQPIISYIKDLDHSVHLVGHSHGATLAALTACTLPNRIRSLALYEPNTFGALDLNHPQDLMYYQSTCEAFDCFNTVNQTPDRYPDLAEKLLDFWLGTGSWHTLPKRLQQQIIGTMKPTLNEVYAVMHDVVDLEALAPLANRTLLMYDPHTPKEALQVIQRYKMVLGDCKTQVFPSLGHLAPIHYPEQVNPVIQAHIQFHALSNIDS
jgi:pimeloyl-ACP methyl ester carboxylesterase